MIPRTGGIALTWARYQADNDVYWQKGYCLRFTRLCFNVAAKYPSAKEAWRNAKHRHAAGTKRPPRAVPVYFLAPGLPYGHVAFSAGLGYVYTTDYPRVSRVALVAISELERAWNCQMVGWAEDINDVRIWTPPPPKDWFDMATKAELAEVVEAKLREMEPYIHRVVQEAVQAELGNEGALVAKQTWGYQLPDPNSTTTPPKTYAAGSWLRGRDSALKKAGDRIIAALKH